MVVRQPMEASMSLFNRLLETRAAAMVRNASTNRGLLLVLALAATIVAAASLKALIATPREELATLTVFSILVAITSAKRAWLGAEQDVAEQAPHASRATSA